MRLNLPVSQEEYRFEDGKSIVSKTDLNGNIVYVNANFCEICGFGEDELIGQPQNIVRHPDMPPEAFRDMWQTLQADQPWTGVVKNRRKDGGHYWVLANVAPIKDDGRSVGYISVRTKPSAAQVAAAARAYSEISGANPRRLVIRHGEVVGSGMLSRLAARRARLSHEARFGATIALLMLLVTASVCLGLSTGLHAARLWNAALMACCGAVLLHSWLSLRATVFLPIRRAADMVGAIAGGDLSGAVSDTRAAGVEQLMCALQQMRVNLVAIIGDVHSNIRMIQNETLDIRQANTDLSLRTQTQAASLEEASASMEQIATTIRHSADNADAGDRLVSGTSAVAARGGQAVAQVGQTMDVISSTASKIADITSTIDGIAFQTNLLALNAAVEAARAGNAGRGFGVVATEVRLLAQRAGSAAREIKVLTDASSDQLMLGNRLVSEAASTMGEMVHSVNGVAHLMHEIRQASHEQSAGVDEINGAMLQLDQTTQQNAVLVEETVAVANQLEQQVNQLSEAVGLFKLDARKRAPVAAANAALRRPARFDARIAAA